MLTQKAKFYKNLCINQISQTNFKSFSNQRSDTGSILTSLNCFLHFFFTFWTLKHLRHSESTQALGHLESTQKALGQLESTWALGGHSGTRTLRAPGTWAFGHLRHLGTQALGYLERLDTRALKALGHSGYFI